MPYYSFKVRSAEEVIIASRLLTIGEGIDVFNKAIDDLPEFLGELKLLGIEVLECNQLDSLEAIFPSNLALLDRIDAPDALLSDGEQHSPET